jgi:hypothetical protein
LFLETLTLGLTETKSLLLSGAKLENRRIGKSYTVCLVAHPLYLSKGPWNQDQALPNTWECGLQKVFDVND